MVNWLIASLFLAVSAAPGWFPVAGEGQADCDGNACFASETPGPVAEISTGSASGLRVLHPGKALLEIGEHSRLSLGEGVVWLKGGFVLHAAPNRDVPVAIETGTSRETVHVQGLAWFSKRGEEILACVGNSSRLVLEEGKTLESSDDETCWKHREEAGWEIAERMPLKTAFSPAETQKKPLSPLAFENPPELTVSSQASHGDASSSSGDSKEGSGGGGESICLDSGGGGAEAGDVGGDNTGVEIERGKARLNVRVEIR